MSRAPAEHASRARGVNVVAACAGLFGAAAFGLIKLTWPSTEVDQSCEAREAPLPELCSTFRQLDSEPWRVGLLFAALALWAVGGAIGWSRWRSGHLERRGPPPAFLDRGLDRSVLTRRLLVSAVAVVAAAISWGTGTSNQVSETVGPVCTSLETTEVCRTSTVVVERTVTAADGLPTWPGFAGWLLALLTLAWWMYVIAAENLGRRFGVETLWKDALAQRRLQAPTYPVEQRRGKRY